VDAVAVVKLDRLGRSVLNVVRLVEELDGMGVAVICTSQGIDTRKESPCGRMILQIMAAFAEFEKAIIVERTVAGLRVARAAGKVLGRPSRVAIPLEQRAVVIAEWRAARTGLRDLAKRLGGVSVATAQKWASQ
jgi:putative DNA-invertase from lambdoid prophage Rac